jgi:hypothetical protein
MLSLWSVRTVCVWITGRKDSCCLTVTSMCWEMRNRPVWKNCLWSGSMVEEIPLEGEVVEEHAGFTDVFFYTDLTNPYAGYVLNLQKLKAYNRLMFPLAMALNREL